MARLKVGINGMGRIGRTILREIVDRNVDIDVVAVNDLGKPANFVHLLKYDSIHGKFGTEVTLNEDIMTVASHKIKFYAHRDPAEIPWADHGVQLVIDGTGIFKDKEGLGKHLGGTVKKVIMCAPGKNLDGTFVMGINDNEYDSSKHHIVSNASCTTNCLAPVAKVLNDSFGIESGFMTTIHAYTSDQRVLDAEHSDPRRARAAAVSMIPTTTGAAAAVGQVIPALKGKLDGYAIRVPLPNVSLVDLTANLKVKVNKEQINSAMKEAADGYLKGIMKYTEEKLVSCDYMSTRESSTFDSALTNVIGDEGTTVKVVSWYDNEAGFSNRVIDLALLMWKKL